MSVPLDERVMKSKELRPFYHIFVKGLIPRLLYDENGNRLPGADIPALLIKAKMQGVPRIALYCGKSDYLAVDHNKAFLSLCESERVFAELFLSEGTHDHHFWDAAVLQAAKRLFP
jgi:hypothetical protein